MAGDPRLVDRELAELRRRAYGQDADIAADPAAQIRLRELEAREQPAEAADPVEQKAWSEPGFSDDGPAQRHPRRGVPSTSPTGMGWREFGPWATAASAIVVALVAVAALLTTQISSPRADLTLTSRDWSSDVLVPGISTTTLHDWGIPPGALTYHGRVGAIDVWTMAGAGDAVCLLLSVDGSHYKQSCEPGSLEPHIDVRSDPELFPPGSIDPDVPPGSTVRIATWDAVVQVFIARPPAGAVS